MTRILGVGLRCCCCCDCDSGLGSCDGGCEVGCAASGACAWVCDTASGATWSVSGVSSFGKLADGRIDSEACVAVAGRFTAELEVFLDSLSKLGRDRSSGCGCWVSMIAPSRLRARFPPNITLPRLEKERPAMNSSSRRPSDGRETLRGEKMVASASWWMSRRECDGDLGEKRPHLQGGEVALGGLWALELGGWWPRMGSVSVAGAGEPRIRGCIGAEGPAMLPQLLVGLKPDLRSVLLLTFL
jgi:hypothetical protein